MTRSPSGSRPHGQDWPYSTAGRYAEAGGVRWHLVRLGSGPPVVLLHGSASSTHAWAGVVARLESRFSFLIPDLPGHGHSRWLGSPRFGVTAWAQALGALVRAENVEPALVVGHSAGAVLAIRAIEGGQLKARGLLGVNPALGSRDSFMPPSVASILTRLASNRLAARGGAGLFRAFPFARLLLGSTGSKVDPATVARYEHLLSDPDRVRGVLALMAGWDPVGAGTAAGELGIPVRYLAGERDRWVPVRVVRRHASGVPVTVLRNRGHLLPEEDPGAVAMALEELARRVES